MYEEKGSASSRAIANATRDVTATIAYPDINRETAIAAAIASIVTIEPEVALSIIVIRRP